jgi:acyl-CoA synthetase (AMP-forming)/AMP-acid ligase II
MIKKQCYRIELGEIEVALYRHPAVKEAAVLAFPDDDGVPIKAFTSTRSWGGVVGHRTKEILFRESATLYGSKSLLFTRVVAENFDGQGRLSAAQDNEVRQAKM